MVIRPGSAAIALQLSLVISGVQAEVSCSFHSPLLTLVPSSPAQREEAMGRGEE